MKKYIPTVLAVLIVGAISFYVGTKVSSGDVQANAFSGGNVQNGSSQTRQRGAGFGMGMNGQMRNGQQGGSAVQGQILSSDDKSITVQLQGGGSKIVFVDSTTRILKMLEATLTDLTKGTNVVVMGTQNNDGSVTASNIQIRPDFMVNQNDKVAATAKGSSQAQN